MFPVRETNNSESNSDDSQKIGGIDFVEFTRKNFKISFLILFLGCLVSIATMILFGLKSPSTITYRSAITFTMPSSSLGKYPSGMEFSNMDLLSPAVLQIVYDRNGLSNYMNPQEFFSYVSTDPYAPTLEAISKRFADRMSTRNMAMEERQMLEQQLKGELDRVRYYGAIVSVTVPDSVRLPRQLGLKLTEDIPSVWAQYYVQTIGVATPELARSGAPLVDVKLLNSLDYPLAYDYLYGSIDRLDSRLSDIERRAGATTIIDKESQASVEDLRRWAQGLREFSFERIMRPIADLGLTRSPDLTKLAYENLIKDLKRNDVLNIAKAGAVDTIVNDRSASTGQSALGASTPMQGASGSESSTVPQLGDGFIDRIIALSAAGQNTTYRQELLSKKLDLVNASATTKSMIDRAQARLDAIQAFNSGQIGNMDQMVQTFTSTASSATDDLNKYWTIANRLVDLLSGQNLSSEKLLYTDVPIPDRMVRTSFWRSPFVLLLVAGVLFLSVLMALAVALFRTFFSQAQKKRTVAQEIALVSASQELRFIVNMGARAQRKQATVDGLRLGVQMAITHRLEYQIPALISAIILCTDASALANPCPVSTT